MNLQDTNSIKYILEEMDPAERVEFEREMSQDPDLQIEVESIRRMNNKLNRLPLLSPPKQITTSILEQAALKSNKSNIGSGTAYFLSAAVLVLGLTTGSLMIQQSFESAADPSSRKGLSVPVQSSSPQIGQSDRNSSSLQPWTDRDNVLHLSGFETGNSSMTDSEFLRSLNKLRPAANPDGIHRFHRSIQLTNSNR